jgi:bacillosamine biosynthesis N-acetyltransferase PglD-like protein
VRTPIFLDDPGGHARVVLDVIARQQRHDIVAVLDDARDHVPLGARTPADDAPSPHAAGRAALRLLEPVVGRAAG